MNKNELTVKEVSIIIEGLHKAQEYDTAYKILNLFAEQQYYKRRDEEHKYSNITEILKN